jgi:hypothetical protein
MLEAFYKTPTLVPYNGNILLDEASPIIEIVEKPNTVKELAQKSLPVRLFD